MRGVFGVENIPSDTQLRDVIDTHENTEVSSIFKDFLTRLQRAGQLEKYKFLNKFHLVALDGSDYFSSDKVHCDKCLTKKTSDGLHYHHQILQSTIIHPDMKRVIPLAPEFISNKDGMSKQDCEHNAGKRLIDRVKKGSSPITFSLGLRWIVRGGRSRWKIENESFNTLKKSRLSFRT